jgi:exopolyphosphatase/guanosine-5'-triphosphate,3'-diphosphate pyrophosphatase
MKATYEALAEYQKLLTILNVASKDVLVTATEASRVAQNAKEFFSKIKNELGFHITTISGEGEAFYTALGVATGVEIKDPSIVIMDIGGASTELIKLQLNPFNILKSISRGVGSVRATDWKREKLFESKMNEILSNDLNDYTTKDLVCVAGSMTALAGIYKGHKEFDDKSIDGLKINFNEFKNFVTDLEKTNVDNLLLLFPFLGKRAPMVAGGARVAEMFASRLGIDTITISTRGLRYGTLHKGAIDDKFICN